MTNAPRHRLLATTILLSISGLTLAGCGGSTPTTAPVTAPATTAAPSTTAAGGSGGSGGATSTSTGGATPVAIVCNDLKAPVESSHGTAVQSMTELGGICTATLTNGDRVELLWNRFASNQGSFATTTRGLNSVDVPGAAAAAGGFDEMGARVKVLVAGKGAWELSLTPELSASRASVQADVDALSRLASALIAQGIPA